MTSIVEQMEAAKGRIYERQIAEVRWVYLGITLFERLIQELQAERRAFKTSAQYGRFRGRATLDVRGLVYIHEPYMEDLERAVMCDQEGNVLNIIKLEV